MINTINIALSGMTTATKRLNNAATNVANMATTTSVDAASTGKAGTFVPTRFEATSTSYGGVEGKSIPLKPSHSLVYDPSSPMANTDGMIASPNVSLAEEIVQMKLAKISYESNIKLMETAFDMQKTLLDRTKA